VARHADKFLIASAHRLLHGVRPNLCDGPVNDAGELVNHAQVLLFS
jgi:hypothetical protein